MTKQEIKKMIEEASDDREVKNRLMNMIVDVVGVLEEKQPKELKKIEEKMRMMSDKMMSGIDIEYAEYIVNKIYEKNNIKSDRLFTYQKAEQLAKQHKIPLDDFTIEDWYIVLVMAETDFKELLGTNMDNYVTYAKLWLMDKDAPHGGSMKLYDYLCYVSKVIEDDKEIEEDETGYTHTMTESYSRNPYMRNPRRSMYGYDEGDMYDRDVYEDTQSHMRSRGGNVQGQMRMNRYGYGNRRY
jgi:hypothetical protein